MISTHALLNKVRISQRHLERLFREYVGLSPRQYMRVTRFETAVGHLHKTDSFTRLALDLGYYDQAHFNHDFMEFTGLHPTAYLKAVEQFLVQER
jgi:methylphosphotriester-DNA--protein-cysteine methyltransferase